jgi:hypothetical protein
MILPSTAMPKLESPMPRGVRTTTNPFFEVTVKDVSQYQTASHAETPRQREAREREQALSAAINQAATLPASKVVELLLHESQKVPTVRAALKRLQEREPRTGINVAFRGRLLLFSKGELPGGRGRRKKA